MNSRTGQAGRDSSFNSLLKALSPVQSRSEPIRPEDKTGSLQNQSLVWAPALISLSSCICWRQAWWDLALTNQSSRYWWLLKSLCMAINFTCCGQTEWQGLELVCPTLDVKSQSFPGLFLYRYMDIGIPPSTVVLPRVQPQGFLRSQKGLSLDPIGRQCATFGILTNISCPSGHWSGLVTMIPVNILPALIAVRWGWHNFSH